MVWASAVWPVFWGTPPSIGDPLSRPHIPLMPPWESATWGTVNIQRVARYCSSSPLSLAEDYNLLMPSSLYLKHSLVDNKACTKGQGNSSTAKSTCCFCRKPRFISQHAHSGSQPVPEDLKPPSDPSAGTRCTHDTYTYMLTKHLFINKINLIFLTH